MAKLFTNFIINDKIIHILGSLGFMKKVYGFTNEFVGAFPEIINFDNADVLSVVGSGDQYFTAILFGAKNITLFDINENAWYHFVLKFTAIKYLSFEEFWQFFIIDELDNLKLYLKIRDYLPFDVRRFFDMMRVRKIKFSNIKFVELLEDTDYVRIIPYLRQEEYYKLQNLLVKRILPICYIKDFADIALGSERENYDILLLSNIYNWMDLRPIALKSLFAGYKLEKNFNPVIFKYLLDKFDSCLIQALYAWNYYNDINKFKELGFNVNAIPAVKQTEYNEGLNYVLTYKRTK